VLIRILLTQCKNMNEDLDGTSKHKRWLDGDRPVVCK